MERTSCVLSRFIGTIGCTQLHSVLKIGVGSTWTLCCVRLPSGELGMGTRLACGSAKAKGDAVTATARRGTRKKRILSS